jgi:hypothetical protein
MLEGRSADDTTAAGETNTIEESKYSTSFQLLRVGAAPIAEALLSRSHTLGKKSDRIRHESGERKGYRDQGYYGSR